VAPAAFNRAGSRIHYREGLRDITTCLVAVGPKLYPSGIRQPVARSPVADANEKRDWRSFTDFTPVLIEQAILKKRLRLPANRHTLLPILRVSLFEKSPILQALAQSPPPTIMPDLNNQPELPGFFTGQ
jgi:hypothetical protein